MNDSTQPEASVFGAEDLLENARAYKEHKRIVDAASAYGSLEKAIEAVSEIWAALEAQEAEGGRYTPSADLGFGSDNASTVAAKLLGHGTTVGTCRKAFAKLGS